MITPQEKADCLADTFVEAHVNPFANDNPEFTRQTEEMVEQVLNGNVNSISYQLPSVSDTDDNIKKLKRRKAPGLDNITNTLLKNLPRSGVLLLHLIVICCFKLCYFPSEWKVGSVVALPKPGKPPNCPKSFRPISLLSSLSKILEMHILKPIQDHLDASQIIPDDQYGFVRGKSSVGQLFRVKNHIKSNLEQGYSTGMMLLDVERAFDRVWHAGLLSKMIRYQFPSHVVKLVASFLNHRSFHVKVNRASSSQRPANFGVPQGAILSPILYNIFTSDAPNPSPCNRGLFADDTAF